MTRLGDLESVTVSNDIDLFGVATTKKFYDSIQAQEEDRDQRRTYEMRQYSSMARELAESIGAEHDPIITREGVERIQSAGKDLGTGVLFSAGSATRGLYDSIHGTLGALADVDEEINAMIYERRGRAKNYFKWLQSNLKEPPGEEGTYTGGFIRAATGLLAPMSVLRKPIQAGAMMQGLAAKGPQWAKSAEGISSAVAGGIAGALVFDPMQENLSNMLDEMPVLGPFFATIAMEEDDSPALRRAKNAVEGIIGGLAAESLFAAARVVRAHRIAENEIKATQTMNHGMRKLVSQQASEEFEEETKQITEITARRLMGNPQGPWVAREGSSRAEMLRARFGNDIELDDILKRVEDGDPYHGPYFNFSRVRSEEDVDELVKAGLEVASENINAARRGETMTMQQMRDMAEEWGVKVGYSVDDMLARRNSEPFSIEEGWNARAILKDANEAWYTSARIAALSTDPADQVAAQRMTTVWVALTEKFFAGRTTLARSLKAFDLEMDSPTRMADQIQRTLSQVGGMENSQAFFQGVVQLHRTGGSIAQMEHMVKRSLLGKSMDSIREGYTGGLLLANPKTFIKNAASGFAMLATEPMDRAFASGVGYIRGTPDSERIRMAELAHLGHGYLSSLRDATRTMWKTMKTGESSWVEFTKEDLPMKKAISSEAWGLRNKTGIARYFGVVGDAVGGVIRGGSFRVLQSTDDFMKQMAYRGNLHAYSFREVYPKLLAGEVTPEGAARMMSDIVQNPTPGIRKASIDMAAYTTFTNKTGNIANMIKQFRNYGVGTNDAREINPSFMVLPFVDVPANVFAYSFEHMPGLNVLIKRSRDAYSAGGSQRDLALGKVVTGMAIMSLSADLAFQGRLTGSGPPKKKTGQRNALRRIGWQPYAMSPEPGGPLEKPEDAKYHSFSGMDQLAVPMGITADLVEIWKGKDLDDDDYMTWAEFASGTGLAIGELAFERNFLMGFSGFMNAIGEPEMHAPRWTEQQARAFVPRPFSLTATVRDPSIKDTNNPLEAIQSAIPGWRDSLPDRKDLWGNDINPHFVHGQLYEHAVPFRATAIKRSPIDEKLVELGMNEKTPRKNGDMGDFRRWPRVFERFQELAGHELKLFPGDRGETLGLKDYLDRLVSGKHDHSEAFDAAPTTELLAEKSVSQQGIIKGRIALSRRFSKMVIMGRPGAAEKFGIDDDELLGIEGMKEFRQFHAERRQQLEQEIEEATGPRRLPTF